MTSTLGLTLEFYLFLDKNQSLYYLRCSLMQVCIIYIIIYNNIIIIYNYILYNIIYICILYYY